MSELLKIVQHFRTDIQIREKSEIRERTTPADIAIREKSERSEPSDSLNSLISPIGMSEEFLDVPCVCDEKPYPHFQHWDNSGPGSGSTLAPFDPLQAHWSRSAGHPVEALDGKHLRLCLGACRKMTWHRMEEGKWFCGDCGAPGYSRLYAEYRPGVMRADEKPLPMETMAKRRWIHTRQKPRRYKQAKPIEFS